MATNKKKEVKTDYGALVRHLKEEGPKNIYMLWGAEDYLTESYFQEIKKLCVGNGSDFNYHRLDGALPDFQKLAEAVESVPFLSDRTLVEVRGFEPNGLKDSKVQELKEIIQDIPDYCTVVFILPTGYTPDGRLSIIKAVKKIGEAIEFTAQPHNLLIRWIKKRFAALGKNIGDRECERLIFISGELMNRLVPEIEKISGYINGDNVTIDDIDKLAQHIPEADVFIMTEKLSTRDFDGALALTAELLHSGEHPIMLLAVIGMQFRRLYLVKVAMEAGKKRNDIMDIIGMKYPSIVEKIMQSCRGFTLERLALALELCAECDYKMKSSSADDDELLKELILKIAVG